MSNRLSRSHLRLQCLEAKEIRRDSRTVKKWTAHKGEARPFPPNLGELLQPFAVERDMADAPM